MQPNVARCLCYLLNWITGLIFLNIEPHKHDPEVKFHAWQAIFFGIAIFAVWIVLFVVSLIFVSIGLWGFLWIIRLLFWLGFLALTAILMVKAYNGERFKLPLIGDLAEQQAGK